MTLDITGGLSEEQYREIEQQSYEAAVIPELWPKLLKSISAVSGGAGALILCVNERGQFMVTDPILDRVWQRFASEGWASRNGRRGSALAKGLVGVGRFITEEDFFEPGQNEIEPITQDLFRAEGFGWVTGFIVDLPHGDQVVMNIEQYWERGPFRGAALERLNSLYPHLVRATMFAGRASLERVRTAIETLTALGLPAAALSPGGRVVLANEGFDRATHIWTTRQGDQLALHDRVADAQVRQALARIEQSRAPRSVPIRKAPGGPLSGVIQIIPIRRAAHDVFGSTAAIAVLSEGSDAGADSLLIQSLFDLTPAEIAVARGLAAGKTPHEIALEHGRSVATVRNQLKSVMSKTGCSRQVEVVLLMQQLRQKA